MNRRLIKNENNNSTISSNIAMRGYIDISLR